MSIIDICITFLITLLGIAYPILLQVISRLDEKYSSINIIRLFRQEVEFKAFQKALIIALFFVLIYLIYELTIVNEWIRRVPKADTVHQLTILLSTVVLVISFFTFIFKLLKYYVPKDLFKYLANKNGKEKQIYFLALSDILYITIRNQNTSLSKDIYMHFFDAFKEYEQDKESAKKVYPTHYYKSIYESAEQIISIEDNKLKFLEESIFGGNWLFASNNIEEISEDSYRLQWRILKLAIEKNREDLLLRYWTNADQFIPSKMMIYDKPESVKQARNRFLEFNYGLGGHLLYEGMHRTIYKMFNHYNQLPPQYNLLPDILEEVLEIFFDFDDPYDINHPWITSKYDFSGITGIGAEKVIKNWICKYSALLLIRLYTLRHQYVEPITFPNLPETQKDRKLWLDRLPWLKSLIDEVLENQSLIETLNYIHLKEGYFEDTDVKRPQEIIDEIEEKVTEEFQKTRYIQTISDDKFEEFNQEAINFIQKAIKEYDDILNEEEIIKDYTLNKFGYSDWLVKKEYFADNQPISYDTDYLARQLSQKIHHTIPTTLIEQSNEILTFREEDLFPAIEEIAQNRKDLVCLSFGTNINYFRNILNVDGLTETHFGDVEILKLPNFTDHRVSQPLFILRVSELPTIAPCTEQPDLINTFNLKKIDDDLHLYSNIIDLNQHGELREQVIQMGQNPNQIEATKAYVLLLCNLEFRLANTANIVCLEKESGITNNEISEIESIDW